MPRLNGDMSSQIIGHMSGHMSGPMSSQKNDQTNGCSVHTESRCAMSRW